MYTQPFEDRLVCYLCLMTYKLSWVINAKAILIDQ